MKSITSIFNVVICFSVISVLLWATGFSSVLSSCSVTLCFCFAVVIQAGILGLSVVFAVSTAVPKEGTLFSVKRIWEEDGSSQECNRPLFQGIYRQHTFLPHTSITLLLAKVRWTDSLKAVTGLSLQELNRALWGLDILEVTHSWVRLKLGATWEHIATTTTKVVACDLDSFQGLLLISWITFWREHWVKKHCSKELGLSYVRVLQQFWTSTSWSSSQHDQWQRIVETVA